MSNSLKNCDEEDILQWLKVGKYSQKQQAITCLFHRFYPQVTGWVTSHGGAIDDGHDTATAALMSFARAVEAGKYQHQGKLDAFFMLIAKRKFFDTLRSRKRDNPAGVSLSMDEIFPGGNLPDVDWEDSFEVLSQDEGEENRLKLVEKCRNKLSERCKERLDRFYNLKQADIQIASEMGDKSVAVSKVMRNKCMDILRKCVFNN